MGDLAGELELLDNIATEQKMNTQIKKVIFCCIMTAEDYIDAHDKLLQLSLTKAQVDVKAK